MKYMIVCILLALFACNESARMSEPAHASHATNATDSIQADPLKVVNATDPVCDMDMKEHLSDTALIDGQIWGFCSIVCKEKYLESKK